MQTYSFVVALRIWHPNVEPELITRTLQVEPTHQSKAGAPRQTRKGKPLDGTWRESHWSADPFKYGEYLSHDMSVEDVLMEVIEAMNPHKAFFQSLRKEGGRLLVQVSSYSSRNYAFELPPSLMGQLAELGLGFAHDVYPVAQSW